MTPRAAFLSALRAIPNDRRAELTYADAMSGDGEAAQVGAAFSAMLSALWERPDPAPAQMELFEWRA